ncbi:MAG: hypothetical protein JW731_02305, partial [Bacteroidales bacterium]|nr:hypothetical protein [Bacteroidales bacterium]
MQKSIDFLGYIILILFSVIVIGKAHSGIIYQPNCDSIEDINKPIKVTGYTIKPGTDTTWDFPRTIVSDHLVVDSGAVLTITSSVYFANYRKIVVKRGGKLVLDGGILSNTCDQVWQGIELWGRSDYPPDSIHYQGQVVLKNGAVIENAEYGIRTIKVDGIPDESETLDYDYTGGIVSAGNSTFRNCRYGVQFHPYGFENQSGFYKTTF